MKMFKILLLPAVAIIVLAGCGDSHSKKPVSKWATAGTVSVQEAAFTGNMEAIKQNIAAGSNLNEIDPKNGSTPLMTATVFDHVDAAKALIKGGADLNLQNNDGSTTLIIAAFFGRTDIVKALLNAGADKTLKNNAGSTALDTVQAPFETLKPVYDYIGTLLAPAGLKLDYARIQAERPKIAKLLQ